MAAASPFSYTAQYTRFVDHLPTVVTSMQMPHMHCTRRFNMASATVKSMGAVMASALSAADIDMWAAALRGIMTGNAQCGALAGVQQVLEATNTRASRGLHVLYLTCNALLTQASVDITRALLDTHVVVDASYTPDFLQLLVLCAAVAHDSAKLPAVLDALHAQNVQLECLDAALTAAYMHKCQVNDAAAMQSVLEHPFGDAVDVHIGEEFALFTAAKDGSVDALRFILSLQGDKKCNVHSNDEAALCAACRFGHERIVAELLSLTGNDQVDVSAGDGVVLLYACASGSLATVQHLLALPPTRRVRPAVHAQDCLLHAVKVPRMLACLREADHDGRITLPWVECGDILQLAAVRACNADALRVLLGIDQAPEERPACIVDVHADALISAASSPDKACLLAYLSRHSPFSINFLTQSLLAASIARAVCGMDRTTASATLQPLHPTIHALLDWPTPL